MFEIFAFVGFFTISYFIYKYYKSLIYGAKVRYYILGTSVAGAIGDDYAKLFALAMNRTMFNWSQLIGSLRKDKVDPLMGALISACWLVENAPEMPDQERFITYTKLISSDLFMQVKGKFVNYMDEDDANEAIKAVVGIWVC